MLEKSNPILRDIWFFLEISQRALHTTNSKYTEETGVQAKEVEKSPLIFSYGTFGQKKRGVFWVAEGFDCMFYVLKSTFFG
jgi:hypothetical protein